MAGIPFNGDAGRSPLQFHRASETDVCWGLTEGAAGMVSQVRGLAQAIGHPFELKNVTLRMPWKKLWPGLIPVSHAIFNDPVALKSEPAPRVVISCGRQALMASLVLKSQLKDKIFAVHIQDPKIRTTRLDMVIAPQHDGLYGPNVVQSPGALHHVTPELLRAASKSSAAGQLDKLRPRFVMVLLGGPNNCYRFTKESLTPLVAQLRAAVQKQPVDLAILPSRRTPRDIVHMFQQEFGNEHYVWDGQAENPYLAALALCSHIVVTSDSVSMISEAAATEKPVSVFGLPERRQSRRFRRFHAEFAEMGITRPFLGQFDEWLYTSPNPTQRIAELICQQLEKSHVNPSRSAA